MWIITIKGKPATLKEKEMRLFDPVETDVAICCKYVNQCQAAYLYHFGFTWKERPTNVSVKKI